LNCVSCDSLFSSPYFYLCARVYFCFNAIARTSTYSLLFLQYVNELLARSLISSAYQNGSSNPAEAISGNVVMRCCSQLITSQLLPLSFFLKSNSFV
jgi:hypothetical protein